MLVAEDKIYFWWNGLTAGEKLGWVDFISGQYGASAHPGFTDMVSNLSLDYVQ